MFINTNLFIYSQTGFQRHGLFGLKLLEMHQMNLTYMFINKCKLLCSQVLQYYLNRIVQLPEKVCINVNKIEIKILT